MDVRSPTLRRQTSHQRRANKRKPMQGLPRRSEAAKAKSKKQLRETFHPASTVAGAEEPPVSSRPGETGAPLPTDPSLAGPIWRRWRGGENRSQKGHLGPGGVEYRDSQSRLTRLGHAPGPRLASMRFSHGNCDGGHGKSPGISVSFAGAGSKATRHPDLLFVRLVSHHDSFINHSTQLVIVIGVCFRRFSCCSPTGSSSLAESPILLSSFRAFIGEERLQPEFRARLPDAAGV